VAKVTLDPNRRGYQLPRICMRCGADATRHKSKMFSWYPPWVIVLLLGGILPYVLVAVILTKRMRIDAPLCQRHRFHWGSRQALILLSLLGVLGLIVLLVVLTTARQGQQPLLPSAAWWTLPAAFLGWLILIVVVQTTTIRPVEITDYKMTLTSVSPAFADAVREYEMTWRRGPRDAGERWSDRQARRPRADDGPPPDDFERVRRRPDEE
jgi:hypothetical protein